MFIKDVNIRDYILRDFEPIKAPVPIYKLIFERCAIERTTTLNSNFPFARSEIKSVPIIAANRLAQGDLKNVIELTVDVTGFDDIKYDPGNTVGILPQNRDSDVNLVLKSLQMEDKTDTICNFIVRSECKKKTAKVIPTNITIRELLTNCLDLKSIPKKQFLRLLSDSCDSKDEIDFLNCLSSKQGNTLYNSLVVENGLTFLDILELCPSCKPSCEILVEYLARLLPRPYSIANSPLKNKNKLRLVFSILNKNPGLTTEMLQNKAELLLNRPLENANTILLYFRVTNQFCYTKEDVALNQILISVGTGIAPFIGFLEHKDHLVTSGETNIVGKTWLFVGAKSSKYIPHYKYIKDLYDDGKILNKYYECFSQNELKSHNHGYEYVQQLLISNATAFVDFFLLPKTVLYVCADGNLISKSIQSSIVECFKQVLGIENTQALEMIKSFRTEKKYVEDLWL